MNQEKRPLRVAIIGTAARSDYLYGPIVQALPAHFCEKLPAPEFLHGLCGLVERLCRGLGIFVIRKIARPGLCSFIPSVNRCSKIGQGESLLQSWVESFSRF